jgi:mycothiol maleylpyruvate isomerase-like protein
MEVSYLAHNQSERERLRTLAARLSDDDLARTLYEGWTVAAVLAHVAFYDLRALALLQKWERGEGSPSPLDADAINAAMQPLCLAIPPREAARLAITAADAVDQKVETLSPEVLSTLREAGNPVNLNRWEHRGEHLVQIEHALPS